MKKLSFATTCLGNVPQLLLILGLCFQNYVFAQEKASIQDKIIGSTFKGLAKAFIAVTDIERLKRNNIDKINKMDEEKFRRRYAKVYQDIKYLPGQLKAIYGITEDMTKEQAITNIESLNKKKTYEIIDSVPDVVIAAQFKRYLRKTKQRIQGCNLVGQINKLWQKMIRKAGGK